MENILIEAKIDPKGLKFYYFFAILEFCCIVLFPFGIMFLMIASGLKNQKLEVTKSNIRGCYGKLVRRNIDLPIDSINSIEYVKQGGIISIATSSQRIRFEFVLNAKEISDVVNELLRERQSNHGQATVINSASSADELKKYKDLLDSGIITQEEFDAKKKQLLGL